MHIDTQAFLKGGVLDLVPLESETLSKLRSAIAETGLLDPLRSNVVTIKFRRGNRQTLTAVL
jgi:hypothetical protein